MTAPSVAGPSVPRQTAPPPPGTTAISRGGWKCGVCGTKAGDLVCSDCVGLEAERRREKRALRVRTLIAVRDAAAAASQERRGALDQGARQEREVAEESRLKEDIRQVTQRIAEERIRVASAAFALKHHRDILAATRVHVAREQTSAAELKEGLLKGLRRHVEGAKVTLRQRRWRKVVQLFVLLPVQPSLPSVPSGGVGCPPRQGSSDADSRGVSRDGAKGKDRGAAPTAAGMAGASGIAEAVVRGVSTVLDLPLPNNGDYNHMPADVVMAGLSSVARLVLGVARYLGVHLPHPLFPAASMSYAAIAVDSSSRERSTKYPLCPLSKLAEIGVTGGASPVFNTVGAFETALDLLRRWEAASSVNKVGNFRASRWSDVVHLCVEGAGVPVDNLWPAEAILLNLWELQQHAISELRRSSPMVDVPLPLPRDPSSEFNKGMRRATSAPVQLTYSGKAPQRPHYATARGGFAVGSIGSGGRGEPGVGSTRAGVFGLDRSSNPNRTEATVGSGVSGGSHENSTANDGTFSEQMEDEENTYEFVLDDGAGEGVGMDEKSRSARRADDGGNGSEASAAGLPSHRYAERMRSWTSRLAAAGGASLGPW